MKDPDTGARKRLVRPQSEWAIEQRPELRIVTDEAWTAVRQRMGTSRVTGGRSGRGGIPTTLFGGLLRAAGGSLVKVDAHRYGCATHKDRGTAVCKGLSAPLAIVDRTLIDHLSHELGSPSTIAEIVAQATGMRRARIQQSAITSMRPVGLPVWRSGTRERGDADPAAVEVVDLDERTLVSEGIHFSHDASVSIRSRMNAECISNAGSSG